MKLIHNLEFKAWKMDQVHNYLHQINLRKAKMLVKNHQFIGSASNLKTQP